MALLAGAKAATPRLDRRDHEAVRNVRFMLSVLFLVSVTVLMTLYDDFYRNQTTLYLVVGPAAAVFGAAFGFLASRASDWASAFLFFFAVFLSLGGMLCTRARSF